MPTASDQAPHETTRHDAAHLANEPPLTDKPPETIRNDVERFGNNTSPNSFEGGAFGDDPDSDVPIPDPAVGNGGVHVRETNRHDVARFGSAPTAASGKTDLVVAEGRAHGKREPVADSKETFRPPSGIVPVDFSKLPLKDPDVPDGVLPYADVLCSRQHAAIELLLSGERPGAVAQKLGIGRTTLWRWRRYDWQFRRALAAARQAAFGEAIERLRGLVPDAVDVLHARLKVGSDVAAARLLRLARVAHYQPEMEDEPQCGNDY